MDNTATTFDERLCCFAAIVTPPALLSFLVSGIVGLEINAWPFLFLLKQVQRAMPRPPGEAFPHRDPRASLDLVPAQGFR